MGRNCGYLALMSALATGADAVLIPEEPPTRSALEDILPRRLRAGRGGLVGGGQGHLRA
jgi:6-phosphofructokinase 1